MTAQYHPPVHSGLPFWAGAEPERGEMVLGPSNFTAHAESTVHVRVALACGVKVPRRSEMANPDDLTSELLWHRLFITAREVQEGFLRQRGRSISRTTLDIWEGDGMDVFRRGGRKYYRWEEVWSWFLNGRHALPSLNQVS